MAGGHERAGLGGGQGREEAGGLKMRTVEAARGKEEQDPARAEGPEGEEGGEIWGPIEYRKWRRLD